MRIKRASAAVLAAIAVAVGGSVVAASPATAADTCAGSQVASMNTYNPSNGNLIAITRAYRGNGQICVVSVKQNGYYGKNTHMELWMYKAGVNPKNDSGNFLYMAGPVRMTDNGCIHFELDLWNGPTPGGSNIAQDYYYPGVSC